MKESMLLDLHELLPSSSVLQTHFQALYDAKIFFSTRVKLLEPRDGKRASGPATAVETELDEHSCILNAT